MGLRRHQIENLVLRGRVFYWRARIPVRFVSEAGNGRLSLSLRLSDRKKASVVARRLNALLLQLELMPMAKMATKEQLTKIFALEIDAMRVTVMPFAWDWVAVDVEGLSWERTQEVLHDWFMRWFDEDDSNSLEEPGLLGVVHFVSDPVEDDEGRFSVTADLGSAPVEVIDDLLFRLLDAGASGVSVGQPEEIPGSLS